MDLSFYRDRKVFVTGHNGFKGSWMCRTLSDAGAVVCGFSLPCPEEGAFRSMCLEDNVTSIHGDIGQIEGVKKALLNFDPEVVIHLAAQPLVLESYRDPVGTYQTNVMGTVNILEAVRECKSVISVVNVTTDKVYRNLEREEGYSENEMLDGHDPYSNSKSCSELITATYKRSFFDKLDIPVSTCRAGNVIGGGDYAKDRIIPDCVRSAKNGRTMVLRNPNSVRPYQHVLDPTYAYLILAAGQAKKHSLAGSYNIGPDKEDTVTTQRLTQMFCENWKGAEWKISKDANMFHEAGILRLDCSKFKKAFGWRPRWHIEDAVKKTVEWYQADHQGKDMGRFTAGQIEEFMD